MNEMVIEAVISAFTLGGIIGAAVALSLRSSTQWREADNQLKAIAIKNTRRWR